MSLKYLLYLFFLLVLVLLVNAAYIPPSPNNVAQSLPGNYIAPSPDNVAQVLGDAAAPPVDSCTYTGGNWDIEFSDNCIITINVDVLGNNITISGFGNFTMDKGNVTGFLVRRALGVSGKLSRIRSLTGGGFK